MITTIVSYHFIANKKRKNDFLIYFFVFYSCLLDGQYGQLFKIDNKFIHPQFVMGKSDYDIAIIALKQDIVYNVAVGPICLPFK